MTDVDTRAKILTATMELAAEKAFLSLSFGEIATRAGVDLAVLRQRYADRIAILTDFFASIDEQVLAGGIADGSGLGEPARDRLFDILMRRFDALRPYRAGLQGLRTAARRDPLFAVTLNRIAVGAHMWTLAAADLEPAGPFAPVRRLARAQAIALVMARTLPVFLDEDSADMPKTMAALDSALQSLDRAAKSVTRMESAIDRLVGRLSKRTSKAEADDAPMPDPVPPKAPSPASGGARPSGVFTRDEIAANGTSETEQKPQSADDASAAATAPVDDAPVRPPTRASAGRRPRQPKSSAS